MKELRVEEWVDIVGYENSYSVSSLGRVRSKQRERRNGFGVKTIPRRYLKLSSDITGYIRVTLCDVGNDKPFHVHVLVAQAFLGYNVKGYHVVDHINDNKTDNRIENLHIISPRDNVSKGRTGVIGYRGVTLCKKTGKFRVRPKFLTERVHIKSFKNKKVAHAVYLMSIQNYELDVEYFRDCVIPQGKKAILNYLTGCNYVCNI